MSSIQERLQLKRVPLDSWNIREQLCLASAVVRSGDQNWMSVSRALKTVGDPNRPPDWYSQKSCAAQYGALLENVETPKRKKRSSEGAVETPQESIVKKLTQERMVEINKLMVDLNQQYDGLKSEIMELRNPLISEDRVNEIWANIEASKRAREREQAKRLISLREREERHARAEKNWRPAPPTPATSASSPVVLPGPQPSSPLLSSLLKSSPVVTTPQHIPHPATVVESMSPSAGAPTLSMLLDKRPSTQENEHAAIEHIKSEIVQLAKQLKVAASSSSSQPMPIVPAVSVAPSPATDKIDIDDIEIKAEDVYAFSDIDIEIPPVSSIHSKTQISRNAEKLSLIGTKKEDDVPVVAAEAVEEKPEEPAVEAANEIHSLQPPPEPELDIQKEPSPAPMQVQEETAEPQPVEEEAVKVSFPEVKFPTPEIKVIQAEEPKVKDVKPPEVLPEVTEPEEEVNMEAVEEESLPEATEQSEAEMPVPEVVEQAPEEPEEVPTEAAPVPEVASAAENEPVVESNVEEENESTSTPEENKEEPPREEESAPVEEATPEVEPAQESMPEEKKVEEENKDEAKEVATEAAVKEEPLEDLEESMTLQEVKEGIIESLAAPTVSKEEMKAEEPSAAEESHQETDDDTPMELIREEEKDGKKKRDYSRKRKYESRTWSGSESAPESPVANDAEKQHKMWKKSVMLVHSRLCAHKYASLFLRPITNDQAPNYDEIVKKPMDLSTIKKHIDAGIIRTTTEFHRCILLMLSNALFYNSVTHDVHQMTKEMHKEADAQLAMLLQAQAHAELPQTTQRLNKRRSVTAIVPAKRSRRE